MLIETIKSKKRQARQRIQADTERWLAQGNRIQQLNSDQSSYRLLTRREHNERLYYQNTTNVQRTPLLLNEVAIMKREDIRIGQIWKRKDGRLVEITDSRVSRGTLEFELTPVEKGRKSWKWDGGIIDALEFVKAAEDK